VAAAGLMPLPMPGLPSVTFTGTGNFLRTCAEMAVPVALAAWLPRMILSRLRRHLALVLAGLLVVFIAGGASMTRLARLRATEAHPVAAPQPGPVRDAASPLGPHPGAPLAAPVPIDDAARIQRLLPDLDLAALEAAVAAAADAELEDPGWEEIERRRQTAERLREWIAAGPRATGPALFGGLLAEGETVPVYADGELRGIELQNVRPDGFYARLGLREGDLVESINGVTFDAPDASGALLRELARSPQIELSVERSDGTPERITVPRQQLLDGLQALE